MNIFEILSPILLLVALGHFLARVRFLGPEFIGDLNKLAFWVALPALLFRSAAHAGPSGAQALHLSGLMVLVTLLAAAAGWMAAAALGLPMRSRGTLAQSAFRGNLAYIAIPVLSYALEGAEGGREAFSTAVIVMTLLMAVYNVLAVIVLQASRGEASCGMAGAALKGIIKNPLLLAGLAGLLAGVSHTPLPLFLDRTLEALGGAAVPISLLCIGGSLHAAKFGGRASPIAAAAVLKTAGVPLLVYWLAPAFGLSAAELRIALVLAAAPTAAASYVMASQMDGDGPLASGSIVLSTVLAAISVPLALWLSS